jgi:hypothetical protein
LPVKQIPLYQKLSVKVKQFRILGMSFNEIAKILNTNETTILRACKYKNN